MQMTEKIAVLAMLLVGPATAFAQPEGAPGGTVLFSFVGGAVGGFLGALLACWLCNRRRESKDTTDLKRG